jgi:hypothetical protein
MPETEYKNDILHKQMELKQLKLLAARKMLDSRAKQVLLAQIILSVPVVMLFSCIASIFPPFKNFNASWGILITLLDLYVLSDLKNWYRSMAAAIQEKFDTLVLDIPWNSLKIGEEPDTNMVISYAEEYKKHFQDPDYEKMKNWYYPAGIEKLPITKARIICQEINCLWDSKIHSLYRRAILLILVILSLAVYLLGVRNGYKLDNFVLSIVAPLMPAFVLGIGLIREHKRIAQRADHLSRYINHIWDKIHQEPAYEAQSGQEARNIQNEIYDQRSQSPLVFNWSDDLLDTLYKDSINKIIEEKIRLENP